MKLVSVATKNIGGLRNALTILPGGPITALAGPNGSGKSKFLSCLAAPWTNFIPAAADESQESCVELNLEFDSAEIIAQAQYAQEKQVADGSPQENLRVRITNTPLAGGKWWTNPAESSWIIEMLRSPEVLQRVPSLNFVAIPAERRLTTQGSPLTLVSINAEDNARSASEMRGLSMGSGVLDDYEFEDYARTLCIAAYLPNSKGELDSAAGSAWERFRSGVDGVLSPKLLLPLTQEEPNNLRIQLPDGMTHHLNGLSSGERQALIIISRIFRAGEGHSLVSVDEPDAYLHPSLSTKLLQALRLGLPAGSGLVVATHSPAILDSIDPRDIIRFQHGAAPTPVIDEADRIDLYREAGFRSSSITQSSVLMVTEGAIDGQVLRDLIPELTSAAIHSAGGRDLVFRDVAALAGFRLPILGVVDADILASEPPSPISELCHVWTSADLEGVLLSSDAFLESAFQAKLFLPHLKSVHDVRVALDAIRDGFEHHFVNEYTVQLLRRAHNLEWPTPRDAELRSKLEAMKVEMIGGSRMDVDEAFAEARRVWADSSRSRWQLVRGKYVLKAALRTMSSMGSTDAFVRAGIVGRPQINEVELLRTKIVASIQR